MLEKSLDSGVDAWLDHVKISHLSEWDVLIFLYRHGTSLASAGQIANFIGYPRDSAGKALDNLEARGLVARSRSSQGVRLYRFAMPSDAAGRQCMEQLLPLSETRRGRLLVAKILQARAGPILAFGRAGMHIA